MDAMAAQVNNFALLDEYQQERICRGTLDLVNRIRKNNPALWQRIQEAAREMEEQNGRTES